MIEMLGCNDDVTVWNKYRMDGKDVFYRHIIPVKCRWAGNIAREVSGNTANISGSFIVIIPFTDMYRPFGEWKALSESDKVLYFTVQNGDIAALGGIHTDITNEKPYTANEVKDMYMPDAFIVRAFPDNTRSQLGKHIRIEGN